MERDLFTLKTNDFSLKWFCKMLFALTVEHSYRKYGFCELAADQVLCHYVTLQGLKNTDGDKRRIGMGIKEKMGINRNYLIWELGFVLDNEES